MFKVSPTLLINQISKKLESQGRKVYKFGLGQSPFPVPQILVDQLCHYAKQKDYLPVVGLPQLRQSIAKYYSSKTGIAYKAQNVMIGPGSKQLIFQIQYAYRGDTTCLPIPSWVSYEPQAKLCHKKVKKLRTTMQQNWHITPQQLKQVKDCLLIINSPNNPSGTVLKNIKQIAQIIIQNNITVVSDQIYSQLQYQGEYQYIAKYAPKNCIITSGVSKWAGAGGWRLGFAIIPDQLKQLSNDMRAMASETFSSVSAPIQYACISAYNQSHQLYLAKCRKILETISLKIYSKLIGAGVRVVKPEGGFYMLVDFSDKVKGVSSQQFCERVLEQVGLAMLSGVQFGFQSEYVISRIAFVDFDGQKALCCQQWQQVCGKMYEGVDNLIKWLNEYIKI